jgi:serine/threonine protein kinase
VAGAEPIPGYRLIEFLGRGGFGDVWKCEAPGGLFKAIKFVNGNLAGLESDGAQARQEFEALERIKAIRHPFILSLDRVEIIGGELLIVMELADRSLLDLLAADQAAGQPGIPRDELLGYLAEAAEALDVMNLRHSLLHLDIKPGNLFLIADHVKVADFGLVNQLSAATPDDSRAQLGGITPLYSSPETFLGSLSAQSDQYSLAMVYCELLTGVTPFDGKNSRQLALQHVHELPKLDAVPESDRPALSRALAKRSADRFASCSEFVHALMLGDRASPGPGSPHDLSCRNASRVIRIPRAAPPAVAPPAHLTRPVRMSGRGAGGPLSRSRISVTGDTPAVAARSAETLTSREAAPAFCHALPGFKFLTLLGQSLFGEVWKVEAPGGHPRLLQFLPPLTGLEPETERAYLERLASLSHPALPALELLEAETGRLVLVMDSFDQTVQDRCRISQAQRLPGVPRAELLGYLWSAAEAIDYLHGSEDIHHFALTPRSLLLAGDELLVAEAGLAELFGLNADPRAFQVIARYAAPELLDGAPVGASDQYSLALIYCEMLTGLHPYRGQSVQRLSKGRERPRPSLDLLPAADREVLSRALHTDPNRRFPCCAEMVRALETGDAEAAPLQAKSFAPRTPAAPEPANPVAEFDPARGMDGLHRILEELGGVSGVVTGARGKQAMPAAGVEHTCGARVYGPTARLKLEGFRQQWGGQVVRVEPDFIVFRVSIGQSLWRRCIGKEQAGLEVSIHFQQPQAIGSQLTQVTIQLRPVGCSEQEGKRLLDEAAPLLLDSIRSYLQVAPERRSQDRKAFCQTIRIYPVYPSRVDHAGLDCRSKDISLRGIGFLLGEEPPSLRVIISLPIAGSSEPIALPAEIVRVQRRADGQYEVGARFSFGGFGANAAN